MTPMLQQKSSARPASCGVLCAHASEQRSRHHKQTLQRKAAEPMTVNEVPPIVHEVLNSAGNPLTTEARKFMEPRFGENFSRIAVSDSRQATRNELVVDSPKSAAEQEADSIAKQVIHNTAPNEEKPSSPLPVVDFSKIRVHTGALAEKSAQSINALAYTVGTDIVFGSGQFSPSTADGRLLLAHELTHTIQHSGPIRRKEAESNTSSIETPAQLAHQLREAFRGIGTDEDEVYRVLSLSPATVQATYVYYDAHFNDHTGSGLIEDIKDEMSGSELGRAMILLENAGIAVKGLQAETPAQLAGEMREAFRGLGTDEDQVYRILSYPPDQVRAMVNSYNENFNDHTGKGLIEDIRDEFSGEELEKAVSLLSNAKLQEHTTEQTTQIKSNVPGEPNKVWAGLIVRGMWSKNHEPGVMEQHADVVIPDAAGKMRTRGYFGDQPGATGSSASIGMGLAGVSADMAWFLQNRPAYVILELAKLLNLRSSLILLKVTKAQAEDLNQYWEDLKKDPGTFNILGKNCSTAAAAGFEHVQLSKEIIGLDTPDNLFQQLRKKYSDAFMISGYFGYTRSGLVVGTVGGEPGILSLGTGSWNGPYVVEQKLS